MIDTAKMKIRRQEVVYSYFILPHRKHDADSNESENDDNRRRDKKKLENRCLKLFLMINDFGFLSHFLCRNKSLRKDTGYSTGSSHEDKKRRRDKRKSRKDDDSPERSSSSKKRRKSRESSKEEEEK